MFIARVLTVGFLSLALSSQLTQAATSSVTLAWDSTPSVAGYRLYMGIASHNYLTMLDVGPSTTVTVANLVPGTTYYFAVTDYDTNQLESAFSGEISYSPPALTGQTKLHLSFTFTGQALLSGTGPVNYAYTVQTSTNLLTWSNVGSVTNNLLGTFQYLDTAKPACNCYYYYRLRQLSP